MEAHEYANAFPMATDGEIEQMAADIKARGLLNPIIVLDGKILDGRNRARACEIADVTPEYEVYRGTDPLGDVVAWNLHRRQLTTSQRAEVARTLKPLFEEQAKARERMNNESRANLPDSAKGKATDQAAAAVGVSGRTVQDAEYVHTHAPELSEEIKAGRLTVNAAKEEVRKREGTQKRPASFKTPEQEEAWYAKQKQKEGEDQDASEKKREPMIPRMIKEAISRLRTELDLCGAKGWPRCDKAAVKREIVKLERMLQ